METIKYLYQRFLLRDVLSFIVPGTIIVLSIVYLFDRNLYEILPDSQHGSSLIYIPIFGLLYIIGFAVQCFGAELIPIIRFHNRRCKKHEDKVCFWQRPCKDCFYEHLKALGEVLKIPNERGGDIKDQHERFVVLKQMCGNNALALLIAFLLVLLKIFWKGYSVHLIIILVMIIIVFYFLYKGYEKHLDKQEMWENLVKTYNLNNVRET